MNSYRNIQIANIFERRVTVPTIVPPRLPVVESFESKLLKLERKLKYIQHQKRALGDRVTNLRARIAKKDEQSNDSKQPLTLKKSLDHFLAFVKRNSLDFAPKTVIEAFLKNAETRDDAKRIIKSQKRISRTRRTVVLKKSKILMDKYYEDRLNVNRIFRTQKELEKNKQSLAIVFGKNILKAATSTMLLYHKPLENEFNDYKIIMAHFDGKFSKCPRGYKQSIELRLVLAKGQSQITITFARALIKGCKKADYIEFFSKVKNLKCKGFKHIVTDFEFPVFNAILEVFPNTRVRGCWFHYWNNLIAKAGRLKRWLKQISSRPVIRFLSLLCFLHHPEMFIARLLQLISDSEGELQFRHIDYKLAIYVFNIYLQRYRKIFFIDLKASTIRTNNSCEGSNAGLARFRPFRLSLNEFNEYAQMTCKRDAIRVPHSVSPPTPVDNFLLQLQKASKHNVNDVFDYILSVSPDINFTIQAPDQPMPKFSRQAWVNSAKHSEDCWTKLTQDKKRYLEFVAKKRADRFKTKNLRPLKTEDKLYQKEGNHLHIQNKELTTENVVCNTREDKNLHLVFSTKISENINWDDSSEDQTEEFNIDESWEENMVTEVDWKERKVSSIVQRKTGKSIVNK